MARMNVNPTRMELNRLKARLKTAVRGHKLLKDKTDEMIRRFTVLIRENRRLRLKIEGEVAGVLTQFAVARSLMSKNDVELAFSIPSVSMELDFDKGNIMNVGVPVLHLKSNRSANMYPYFYSDVTSEADESVRLCSKMMDDLIRLAEVEKSANMLAEEIEKSKRRVNALEYVLIPDLNETIKYITMKLEENDRSSRTRLMKVKSMLAEKKDV